LGTFVDLLTVLLLEPRLHTTTRFNRHGVVPWLLRVPISRVDVLSKVGEGGFGVVYRARYGGEIVAMKAIGGPALQRRQIDQVTEALEAEATLLSKA
jgi:predicted Ser/Thr protein kinase